MIVVKILLALIPILFVGVGSVRADYCGGGSRGTSYCPACDPDDQPGCSNSGWFCTGNYSGGCSGLGYSACIDVNPASNPACRTDVQCTSCNWIVTQPNPTNPPPQPTNPPPTATPVPNPGNAWCGNCGGPFTCALRTITECNDLGYSTAGCTGECNPPDPDPPTPTPDTNVVGYHDGYGNPNPTPQLQNPNFCNAFGWATDPDNVSQDVNVRVLVGGTPRTTPALATTFRSDLQTNGICTGGTCAYEHFLNGIVPYNQPVSVEVQAQDINTGGWQTLTSSPRTLTCSLPAPTVSYTCSTSGVNTLVTLNWAPGVTGAGSYVVRLNRNPNTAPDSTNWDPGNEATSGDIYRTVFSGGLAFGPQTITPNTPYRYSVQSYYANNAGNNIYAGAQSSDIVYGTPVDRILNCPPPAVSWFQTGGGNVTTYTAFDNSDMPLDQSFARGVVTTSIGNPDLGEGELLTTQVSDARLSPALKDYDFDFFVNRIKNYLPTNFNQAGGGLSLSTSIPFSDNVPGNIPTIMSAERVADTYRYYEYTGTATIGPFNVNNSRFVVIVNGDANIVGPIQVGTTGNLILIASGNITVSDSVGSLGVTPLTSPVSQNLAGIYFAGGTFQSGCGGTCTDTTASQRRSLRVDGAVVAMENVDLRRLSTLSYPGMYFNYRPDLVVRMPQPFLQNFRQFEEVAP